MSATTLQAVHEAIAAHIADEADGDTVYLTDWQLTAAAARDTGTTLYFNVGTNSPYHSRLGLLYRGLEMLEGEE
ncbi:hypothetical protein [Arthrobacter sp. C152]